jgi:hypothetical protein
MDVRIMAESMDVRIMAESMDVDYLECIKFILLDMVERLSTPDLQDVVYLCLCYLDFRENDLCARFYIYCEINRLDKYRVLAIMEFHFKISALKLFDFLDKTKDFKKVLSNNSVNINVEISDIADIDFQTFDII